MRGNESTSSLRDTPIWLGSSASSLFCVASAGNAISGERLAAGAMRNVSAAFATASAGFETPYTATAHAMKDAHDRAVAIQILSMRPLSHRQAQILPDWGPGNDGDFYRDYFTCASLFGAGEGHRDRRPARGAR